MTSGWATRARISRRLSNTGDEELIFSELEKMSSFAKSIYELKDAAAIDRRTVAIGPDIENFWYDTLIDMPEDLSNIVWQYNAHMKIWYDMLSGVGTAENPRKILTSFAAPHKFYMEMMSDRTKEITILNNLDLYYFEKLYIDAALIASYPNLSYSSIAMSDILNGNKNNYFDLVRVGAHSTEKINLDTISSLMNSVSLNGFFVLNDASEYGEMYHSVEEQYRLPVWDTCKYIQGRSDFISYHLPYDVGLVVAKRVA